MDETQLPAVSRRGALKALGALAAAAGGMTVQPLERQDAEGLELVILTPGHEPCQEEIEQLGKAWERATVGTSLAGVRLLVLQPGTHLQLVRRGWTTAADVRKAEGDPA